MDHESQSARDLTFRFRELGDLINSGAGPAAALDRIVSLAQRSVPGAEWVAVTTAGHNPRTLAATDEIARTTDLIQMESESGPCLEAIEGQVVIVAPDLATESRWPEFARRALEETPVRTVLTFTLSEETPVSALNLYSGTAGIFDDESINVATLFAAHAQLAVMHLNAAARSANLEQALSTSRLIGMALGILMSVHKITPDQAFEMLRTASQHLQRKLRDVAQEVTETGMLP